MIVVDVTVLAHYVIEGDETADVLALRERDREWAAPVLWRSELMNVLWKYLSRGDFGLDLALRQLDLAADLVSGRVYDLRAEEVLPLAVASGCSAYDCQYVALARLLDTELATHDRRILNAFPQRARHPREAARLE
jgi:predicted nucleic acid-binding protein